jgi:hypothetical protein
MTLKLRLLAAALPLAFAATAYAAEEPKKEEAPAPDWSWTAHVDVNSAYYLRGITNTYGNNKWDEGAPTAPPSPPAPAVAPGATPWTYPNKGSAKTANDWGDAPESRNPALQWGFDITHSSGFYLGYWGSTLTYSYDRLGKSYDQYKAVANSVPGAPAVPVAPYYSGSPSIENDFYGGYTGKLGDLGYDLGLTYYYYLDGTHSNAPETKVKLTYGDFGLSFQTLLDDTIWGNQGDTYTSLTWTQGLPYGITFTANAGWYFYEKEGKYLGSRDTAKPGSPMCNAAVNLVNPALGGSGTTNGFFFDNGCYESFKTNGEINRDAKVLSDGFRHLILGISQPIGETGLTWNAQAIIPGVNRFNIKQDPKATIGIAYSF